MRKQLLYYMLTCHCAMEMLLLLTLTATGGVSAAVTKTKQGDRQRWSITALESECTQEHMEAKRICDPGKILSDITAADSGGGDGDGDGDGDIDATNSDEYRRITLALQELETNHPLICNNGIDMATSTSTSTSTTQVDVQMAVVAVQKMKLLNEHNFMDDDYMIQQGKNYARTLHNHYGVGHTECNGSGILLFLSVQDRVVYISISHGLRPILTQQRIDHIIDEVMKPYLREEEYGDAVLRAIRAIQEYLDNGPPSFWERNLPNVVPIGIIVFFAGLFFRDHRRQKEYTAVHSKLSQMDRDNALALMGKYECTSCPICLQDFIPIHQEGHCHDGKGAGTGTSTSTGNTQEKYIGSDGKEIQLLRCGHAFDKTCWEKWISAPSSRNTHQCPICREDIGKSQQKTSSQPIHTTETTSMLDSSGSSSSSSSATSGSYITNRHDEGVLGWDATAFRGDTYATNTGTGTRTGTILRGDTGSGWSDNSRRGIFHRHNNNNHYRLYRAERNFRLHRLHMHHPQFIHQSLVDRWIHENGDGEQYNPLAQDEAFVRNDPSRVNASNGTGGGGGSSSFSSFGGGHSGGGGGGRW